MLIEDISVLNRGDADLLNKMERDVDREMLKFAVHIASMPLEPMQEELSNE